MQTSDVIKTKICPECGKLLSRYNVGHGVSFTIDRCEQCRGIWFDANEWEILHVCWGPDLHHNGQHQFALTQ